MSTLRRRPDGPLVNAMTVDVEDYFQVSAFESTVDRDQWENFEQRVDRNTRNILELFARHDVKATFFTLGWVAEQFPELVRDIAAAGHEVASHGWQHTRVNTQQPEDFRNDIRRTRALLQDISGQPVLGYRAASYSIGRSEAWAWDELAEAGYSYSSSIVPISHDLYGIPDAPRFAFDTAQGRLLEIPITTIPFAGRNINCGGGGWFRLFPYSFSRWALRKVNASDVEPGIFYFHPWEIDPDQPRPEGLGLKTRFRHYLNLDRTYGRLEQMLSDFQWGRMDEIFLHGNNTP
jgi:polysaccharide deacetylase family protein (PEP-CTERM system associated)